MAGRSETVQIVIQAIDRASGVFRNVGNAAGNLGKKGGRFMAGGGAGGLASAASKGGMMLAPLGVNPAMLGAGGAALGFVKATSAAADYESQLTAIQKKAGTTDAQTALLGKDALGLATSGEIASSIDEVMSAYERAAAGGLPVEDMREFAKISAMAADAFEMTSEEVGNAAMGFRVGADAIPMAEMEGFFGLINKLADSGIASESGIINFLDRARVSMAQFGIDAQKAAAYAATIENLKMPAEVGARMMGTLTTRLLAPGSPKAERALKGIVGNVGKFKELLKSDANAAMLEFLDSVNKLDKFESAELLTDLLGQGFSDEVQRLAGGVEELRRNLSISADKNSWVNGLGEGYAKKLDDFWSQWQILTNRMKTSLIEVGTSFAMPAALSAMETMANLMDQIAQAPEAFQAGMGAGNIEALKATIEGLAEGFRILFAMGEGSTLVTVFEKLGGIAAGISANLERLQAVGASLGLIEPPTAGRGVSDEQAELDRKTVARDGTFAAADLVGETFGHLVRGIVQTIDTMRRGDPWTNYEDRTDRLPQTGNVKPERFGYDAPPEPPTGDVAAPSRFGYDPAGSDAALAALRSQGLAGGELPAPDMTAYLTAMGQAEQARMKVEEPVVTEADVNTGGYEAKLGAMKAQARAAAAEISGILGSITTGGGASGGGRAGGTAVRQNRDSQFAPGGQ